MTVRWKPLLFLSGLFLVVAMVGVIAITLTLVPRSSQGILKLARTAREAGRFENADIYFKQALQLEPRSAAIHMELAGLYSDWIEHAASDKRQDLRAQWVDHLVNAAKFDKALTEPRRSLLANAMSQDLGPESVYWAKEVLRLEPENADARYVLATDALENPSPNVPEVRRHLEVLDTKNAPLIRRLWIRARLGETIGETRTVDEAIASAGKISLGKDAEAVDRVARLRIAALAVRKETDSTRLQTAVESLLLAVQDLGDSPDLAATRVVRLRLDLEQTQRALLQKSAKLAPAGKKAALGLADAIELALESNFTYVLSHQREPDLQTYLAYADHLRFREKPDRCLEVVGQALKSPQASRPAASRAVMGLHMVAVEMALARATDQGRFERAAPHVRALLESQEPRYQGLGHLFAGSIDLDRSGLAREMAGEQESSASLRDARPKLRSSALHHLKLAAAQLPDIAEAQARYGVALVLAGEQNLGRQFLQAALRKGSLDPQYHLWAAWTVLQAGYPEEAEPIVSGLLQQASQGNVPPGLEAALHLLRGELYQTRRTPEDLQRAVLEFDKALASGSESTAAVVVRLAQIDVQLGEYERASKRLDALAAQGKGTPAVEQLAVLTLQKQGKSELARARLHAARARYPRSADLAGLDAALLAQDKQPEAADRVLAEFLKTDPDNTVLAMMRAQIQVDLLKSPDKARAVLLAAAERTENSAPLVQLAALELDRGQLDAAADIIAKIKARWKEAAAGDVLEAQLALRRGNVPEAVEHFDAALKKDPDNKIVQFWKAQLDSQTGSVVEATKTLEALVRDKPIKEVDTGTTLMSAAQSALANLSLRTGDFDAAIHRFEELKRSGQNGTLTKTDRWQLITALVAKGQWPLAKREIEAILHDSKNPPGDDERVRASNFYRQQGELEPALAQLDRVLQSNPAHPPAVVTRSYILLKEKKYEAAMALLRKAIELASREKEVPAVFYLMLAAVSYESPPAQTALARALVILDQGLARSPEALELVQAKYAALAGSGDLSAALEFAEAKANAYPKGPFRRFLVQVCREQKKFARAEELLRQLLLESPNDASLAAALVQVVSLEAAEAAASNQPPRERELNDKAVAMIRQYRSRYPNNLTFLQAECDLVARRGDYGRAVEITYDIDKIAPTSTLGPMLRARLSSMFDRPGDVASAYAESLERNPRQLDVRVLLGFAQLKLRKADDALHQAKLVLDADKNRLDALLLEARALAESATTKSQEESQRKLAIARLEALKTANPRFLDAYHALAEIHLKRRDRAAAVAVLKEDLQANPFDSAAAAQLMHVLAQRGSTGMPSSASDLAEARKIAEKIASRDEKGRLNLALSIGFYKAGQLELAFPYAQAAATKLDSPAAHLNLGDLLLTTAEGQSDPVKARETFERAVDEYDRVLKSLPSSVEAINNKAWILHTHLGQSTKALALVMDLRKRASAAFLPGEFYDTLGAIQESLGKTREAEQSYLDGLSKSPDHPVLNFHFGKLLAADPSRSAKARTYLNKALAARDRLSPSMAREVDHMIRLIDREKAQN